VLEPHDHELNRSDGHSFRSIGGSHWPASLRTGSAESNG
jgi:hypothetical protein